MRILVNDATIFSTKDIKAIFGKTKVELVTPSDLGITEPDIQADTLEEKCKLCAAYYGKYCDYVIYHDFAKFVMELPRTDPKQIGLRKEAKERTRRTLEDETRTFVLKTLKKVGGKARVFAVNGYALCSNGNVTYYEEDYERAKVNAVGICTKAFYLYHMEDANYDFFGVDKRESVINFFHKKMFVQHPEIKKANQVTQKELSEFVKKSFKL